MRAIGAAVAALADNRRPRVRIPPSRLMAGFDQRSSLRIRATLDQDHRSRRKMVNSKIATTGLGPLGRPSDLQDDRWVGA
jgi:hypothetical protein